MSLSTRQYRTLLLWLALASVPGGSLCAQPPETPADVSQFQHIEDNWSIAFVKKDQYAMELLLAPTFVDISAAGTVSTRNQTIAEMFDHSTGELLSMEQRAVNVRVLGDTALVEGTYVIHYKAGSHTIDERGVFTHVYQRTRANWICVNAQRTAVFDEPDEKQKQTAKKSGAALPFHIPLIYKGADSSQSPPPAAADKQPNP
jgi:ketosteroid isomerase-like protein